MIRLVVLGAGAALAVGAINARAAEPPPLGRGEYIVTRLARCGDCHTPNIHGGGPPGPALSGGPLSFEPIGQGPPNWAPRSPSIAGLPAGRSEAEVATLLETGAYPSGAHLRPPMPQFHMTKADAQAVAAYLASMKP